MRAHFKHVINLATIFKKTVCAWLLTFPVACLIAPQMSFLGPTVSVLHPGATSLEIQKALDALPEGGGMVILPAGNYEISQPIVLRRSHQTLRGTGDATVLRLADDANCPVIIMGKPVNDPKTVVNDLCVAELFIDGNRVHQERELWHLRGEGSEIRNNGIQVQGVSNSIVENVTCARCRSGGLVTTRGVRRLTVKDFSSFDNEFDGLACYQTENCLFTELNLHNNPGAGISLDLAFNDNVISNAVLSANDLGIFMRASCDNQFENISIRHSHHYGVFMAHAETMTKHGWGPIPQTECVHNSFANLFASDCGDAAFRVNNSTCKNNVVISPKFERDVRGGISQAQPDLVMVQ